MTGLSTTTITTINYLLGSEPWRACWGMSGNMDTVSMTNLSTTITTATKTTITTTVHLIVNPDGLAWHVREHGQQPVWHASPPPSPPWPRPPPLSTTYLVVNPDGLAGACETTRTAASMTWLSTTPPPPSPPTKTASTPQITTAYLAEDPDRLLTHVREQEQQPVWPVSLCQLAYHHNHNHQQHQHH